MKISSDPESHAELLTECQWISCIPDNFKAKYLRFNSRKTLTFSLTEWEIINEEYKGGFPLFAETTRSNLASTLYLAEEFPVTT